MSGPGGDDDGAARAERRRRLSLAEGVMADRLQGVIEDVEILQGAVTAFRRVAVTDARRVRMASDHIDECLKLLLEDVSGLCAGFVGKN